MASGPFGVGVLTPDLILPKLQGRGYPKTKDHDDWTRPMENFQTAYKFRASSQIAFALDIIINQRLYCSGWRSLNDPMEGRFSYSYNSASEVDPFKDSEIVIREKRFLKICSLSTSYKSHLMWAHYASGFDGLAIEVEIPTGHVKYVHYTPQFITVSSSNNNNHHEKLAEEILSSKYDVWEYEKEARIIQTGQYFNLTKPVASVIAGHRMNPALFDALRIVCRDKGIRLRKTSIDEREICAVDVWPSEPK